MHNVVAILLVALCALVCARAQAGASEASNPWVDMFGDKLYAWNEARDGVVEVSTEESLSGKSTVAIYFSASWCGPCRQFTPQLASFYEAQNKKGKKLQVVWVSGDRSSDEFLDYYSKMPWLAVPLPIAQRVNAKLSPKYNLKGIPHLVVLDGHDATVYTLDGRTKVAQDKYGLEFPWRPRTIMNLLPRPIARLVKQQLERLKASASQLLAGVLDNLAPRKIVAMVVAKVRELVQEHGQGRVAGKGGVKSKRVGVARRAEAAVAA